MKITNAVVHYIQKERGNPSRIKLRKELLPHGEKLTNLIESLRHLYNEKSGRGYGVFQTDEDVYPLKRLLKDNNSSTFNFLAFSTSSMSLLKQRIDKELFATGGYVLFSTYEESSNRFLLIATLKNKPGLGFDEDLNLSDAQHIDLEHLHEMARLNLTVWGDGGERYLSFAKKNGQDAFSQYFREFIGCNEFTESAHLTKTLLEAVKDYCSAQKMSEEDTQAVKEKTYIYCEEKRVASEEINLTALSSRFDDNNPLNFINFVNTQSEKYQLSDGFEPDRKVYKKLRRFSYRSGGFSISFEAGMLNKSIRYNEQEKTLIISDLPESFYERLHEL